VRAQIHTVNYHTERGAEREKERERQMREEWEMKMKYLKL